MSIRYIQGRIQDFSWGGGVAEIKNGGNLVLAAPIWPPIESFNWAYWYFGPHLGGVGHFFLLVLLLSYYNSWMQLEKPRKTKKKFIKIGQKLTE